MSIAEFYIDNCVDPSDWHGPNGMDAFLGGSREDEVEQYTEESSLRRDYNRKRGRDDDCDSAQGQAHTERALGSMPETITVKKEGEGNSSDGYCRPVKRAKRCKDVVHFATPFPCAFFQRPGGCRYRWSCSYHHGVAQPCDCNDVHCPKVSAVGFVLCVMFSCVVSQSTRCVTKGHANRRAPKPCDHGSVNECRWNLLGECSFHHGIPEACECDSLRCPRAHLKRVKRNVEARKERKLERMKQDPGLANTVARTLFLGTGQAQHSRVNEEYIKKRFDTWIRKSSSAEPGRKLSVVNVRINPDLNCAFVQFRTAEIATACLDSLDGLTLEGWGKVRLERTHDFVPSMAPAPDPSQLIALDASKLGRVEARRVRVTFGRKSEAHKAMTKAKVEENQRIRKEQSKHYQSWKKEQKKLKTGENGQQLRDRYLQLYPEHR